MSPPFKWVLGESKSFIVLLAPLLLHHFSDMVNSNLLASLISLIIVLLVAALHWGRLQEGADEALIPERKCCR